MGRGPARCDRAVARTAGRGLDAGAPQGRLVLSLRVRLVHRRAARPADHRARRLMAGIRGEHCALCRRRHDDHHARESCESGPDPDHATPGRDHGSGPRTAGSGKAGFRSGSGADCARARSADRLVRRPDVAGHVAGIRGCKGRESAHGLVPQSHQGDAGSADFAALRCGRRRRRPGSRAPRRAGRNNPVSGPGRAGWRRPGHGLPRPAR